MAKPDPKARPPAQHETPSKPKPPKRPEHERPQAPRDPPKRRGE